MGVQKTNLPDKLEDSQLPQFHTVHEYNKVKNTVDNNADELTNLKATIENTSNYENMVTSISQKPVNYTTLYMVSADEVNGGGFPGIYLYANNTLIRLIPQLA